MAVMQGPLRRYRQLRLRQAGDSIRLFRCEMHLKCGSGRQDIILILKALFGEQAAQLPEAFALLPLQQRPMADKAVIYLFPQH